MACDFADLVQPGDYSVTAFPAQNGFCTLPVAHRRHDLAGLGPATGLVWVPFVHVARCVSAKYPSAKQLLMLSSQTKSYFPEPDPQ